MIAAAEEVLWPGWRPKAQVAIVLPRSSLLLDERPPASKSHIEDATNNHLNANTVDYMAEVFDLYTALQHANVPVDFLDEDDLSAKGLRDYRVVYLTEPNMPSEAVRGLLQWVRRGGTLVRSPNSGSADRYNDPLPIFAEVLGLHERPIERTIFGSLKELRPAGRVGEGQGAIAIGPRTSLEAT